jgi:hypothetical protein
MSNVVNKIRLVLLLSINILYNAAFCIEVYLVHTCISPLVLVIGIWFSREVWSGNLFVTMKIYIFLQQIVNPKVYV